MLRRIATVALALALVGACGAGDDPTVDLPEGGRTPTSSTSTTNDGGDAFGVSAEVAGTGHGHLVSVRHARQQDFYRVVFEFRESTPGVEVTFADRPIVQDGSGDEITVAGDRVISVVFEPASGYDLEANQPTYTGANRLDADDDPVAEIVRVGDFEAHLEWAIGVDDGARFRVTTFEAPPRVVVDIR